ncbi:MAG: cobalt-precorrin-5B (C(1))-methyltransferase CbiD [Pyramidobacter sp.]|jgi:cobalt-precorrin-5B (C1)-methyltransferase
MESSVPEALREGFTTGSCAAAAAKASALRQLEGRTPRQVEITTPSGKALRLDIVELAYPTCGVVKDAGDDPDVTNGMTVTAAVEIASEHGPIQYAAGAGVGTVTRAGLKVPIGEPAINPVPRRMIEKALRQVIGARGAKVILSIPGGEEKALHTFNPRLGIVGGLSVLGTTGIVKPYNVESVYQSFTLELNTFAVTGAKIIGLTFGNTGEKAMRQAWGLTGRCIMQTGNYIGYVLDEAVRLKFRRVLLCGHPGKLLKVAAGTFDTYNRTGDGRREALCTQAALAGCPVEIIRRLYESSTTEAAMEIMKEEKLDFLWTTLAEVTARRCRDRMFDDLAVEAAFTDNGGKLLGASAGAADFAEELRHET